MEEHVSNIGEVIKGFFTRIEDLQLCSTPGTPPEEREGREKMTMTVIENIKKLEEECAKLCEESAQIWTELGRGSKNEGRGRKIKGCTGKGVEIFREHKHPSTS
jgi:hypothetical protein